MFRQLNSHLQAYSLQVKSQDAVHTLGSRCVYISDIFKPDHLSRRGKLAKYVTNWLKYIYKSKNSILTFTILKNACFTASIASQPWNN